MTKEQIELIEELIECKISLSNYLEPCEAAKYFDEIEQIKEKLLTKQYGTTN